MNRRILWATAALFCLSTGMITAHYTATQNDFAPLYTTRYPFGFLNENRKEFEKGLIKQTIKERAQLSVTLYGQQADATDGSNQDKVECNNGDIYGRWNMIGLTYGAVPTGQTRPALLTAAGGATYHTAERLDHKNYSDTADIMGHFSIPLKYRKAGARMTFSTRIFDDIVLSVQGGVADIKQTYTAFENYARTEAPLTALKAHPETVYGDGGVTAANIEIDLGTIDTNLMNVHEQIFDQMGLNILDTRQTGAEDVYVSFVWRHNKHVNDPESDGDYVYEDDEWERFILIPFFKVTGGIGIGKKKDPAVAFSVPFGNNGHHSLDFTAGLSADFYQDVEITFDVGATHSFKREIHGMFVPTDELQTGVFPFKTDVNYEPGKTWHGGVSLNAYHFLNKLSFYVQYMYINHSCDSITLLTPDSAFKPSVLEDVTKWTIHAANVGFNADLSPHISFGAAWQAPIARRGAYKTNTIAVSLVGTF